MAPSLDTAIATTTRGPFTREAIGSIALIGTYVPRQCGIATFTADLTHGLTAAAGDARVSVVAVNDRIEGYAYPEEVAFEIQKNRLRDYRMAADYLNANRIHAVCVQHEYGIFGGDDGAHILKLIAQLRMPVITTLHTVLRSPTPSQKEIVQQLAVLSDRLIVMSETSSRFLHEVYGIAGHQIAYAPHGIPDMPFVDPNYYRDQFGVEGKKVLLTFGLLSPSKGIETAIRALPRVVAAHPDVVYIVLGATHPHVRAATGEAYRLGVQQLAAELDVDDHVIFCDRYVSLTELCEFLGAADVYVSPYLNEEQIVSGTLAYAMGAGKAVVSTPYWYAKEMLAEGRGRLVGFGDVDELAKAVIQLLSDETSRHAMRKRAYTFSRTAIWSQVAHAYLQAITEVRRERQRTPRVFRAVTTRDRQPMILPEIDLRHLHRLTDDVGILQHATYFVPNRAHGYCTDDNARALIFAAAARAHLPEGAEIDELAVRYIGFLQHALGPEGSFRNFLGYDRHWTESEGSPDSHGRAVWALGISAAGLPDERLQSLSAGLLHEALPKLEHYQGPRSTAFALLGVTSYLGVHPGDSSVKRERQFLAERLFTVFRDRGRAPEWPWPEEQLTYANARLPHALLEAGGQMEREDLIRIGLTSLEWLVDIQTEKSHLSPVGN